MAANQADLFLSLREPQKPFMISLKDILCDTCKHITYDKIIYVYFKKFYDEDDVLYQLLSQLRKLQR
jgi:hypothetical protein